VGGVKILPVIMCGVPSHAMRFEFDPEKDDANRGKRQSGCVPRQAFRGRHGV
jgi:hypothetical protein